jgi:hypothetical protein
MFTPTVPGEEDWKVARREEKTIRSHGAQAARACAALCRMEPKPPNPSQLRVSLRCPGLGGLKTT